MQRGHQQTPDEVRAALTNLQALKITEQEKDLIVKFGLTYERHNDRFIYLQTEAGQEGRMVAADARYWYRAVTMDEYQDLRQTGEFAQSESYGGIATNRSYAKQYLTDQSTSVIIAEFDTLQAGKVYQLFTANGIQIKAEGDGGTYGLGEKGTQDKRAKTATQKAEQKSSRELFNQEYLAKDPRVVNLRIANPL